MQDTIAAYLYTSEQEAAATEAIEARFGKITQVQREIVCEDIRVDLCVIAPAQGSAYYTVVTRGMGAREMHIPDGANDAARAELVIMLPEDWEINNRDECWYWPLRWLKLLARLPLDEGTWLGWGHTVPAGETFAENTDYNSLLLLDAFVPEDNNTFNLPDGQNIQLYQLFPLYEAELQFKLKNGTQALVDRMAEQKLLSPVVDTARRNLFPQEKKPGEKQYCLQKHQLRPLLTDWEGATGCLATDRILIEGAPVGYCYREEPFGDWDSGWRFTAGDESDEYMQDPRNSDTYSLNCIANYDRDILPILQREAPCAFARGPDGLELLKSIKYTIY